MHGKILLGELGQLGCMVKWWLGEFGYMIKWLLGELAELDYMVKCCWVSWMSLVAY